MACTGAVRPGKRDGEIFNFQRQHVFKPWVFGLANTKKTDESGSGSVQEPISSLPRTFDRLAGLGEGLFFIEIDDDDVVGQSLSVEQKGQIDIEFRSARRTALRLSAVGP